jgi:hypothetical protein
MKVYFLIPCASDLLGFVQPHPSSFFKKFFLNFFFLKCWSLIHVTYCENYENPMLVEIYVAKPV